MYKIRIKMNHFKRDFQNLSNRRTYRLIHPSILMVPQVKRLVKVTLQVRDQGVQFSMEGIRKGNLGMLSKMVYKRVRVWTLERSLPLKENGLT